MSVITQLSIQNNTYQLGETISLEFTVKNNSSEPFRFCFWQCPLEGKFTSNFLSVQLHDKPVSYKGILLKRTAPKEQHYLELKPGDSRTTTIDLKDGYKIEEPGEYRISFKGRLINSLPDSEEVTFTIVG
jgi:hypothetical protein